MKTISTTAIVALMTTSLGFAAVAPAMAQPAPVHKQFHMQRGEGDGRAMIRHHRGDLAGPHAGGLGGLLSFGRDAERIEIALVRLSYRLDLTDEQQALLDDLRTAAVAAQADFAAATEAARPEPVEGERPDIAARLQMRIAFETAHVAALTAVQPAFEAFFASLTDEQLESLKPQRHERPGRPGAERPDAPAPDAPAPEAPAEDAPAPADEAPAPANG
jgi:hypothetical protein